MTDARRAPAHLMLINPSRVFYAGLLGRPRRRKTGAFQIYVCLEGTLAIARGGRLERGLSMAVVDPYVEHTIESEHPTILCVTVEPETVSPEALAGLGARLAARPEETVRRMRRAYHRLLAEPRPEGLDREAFDALFFGAPLPVRRLDARIARALARLEEFSGPPASAADCAVEARLSPSRFLHLFKQETGFSFRALRAYKRARHILHFANRDINFAHLAQDIGYPDSTHFSHSIRRFYGLKPSAIFTGSRDLQIYPRAALAAGSV